MRTSLYTKGFVGGPYGFIARTGASSGPVTPSLVSITVTPSNSTLTPLSAADTQQMTATGVYDSGPDQDLTATVTWGSGTVGVATIDAAGLATPAGTGTSVITATLGAVSGNTNLTVDTARDATSGIRVPENAYQWALGGYTVAGLYLCQEASGNLTDSVGALTLTANATPLYQQAVAGWTRLGLGFNNTANQRFQAASGAGANPATTDLFWCWLMSANTIPAATTRQLMALGTNCNVIQFATSGNLRITVPGFTADDSTTRPDLDDLVHPIGVQHDITNTRNGLYTDEAKTQPAYAAVTDNTKGVGGLGGTTSPEAPSFVVYGFRFEGAPARMDDAAIKALYQWLGYTVPWS